MKRKGDEISQSFYTPEGRPEGRVVCLCGINVLPMSLMSYEVAGFSHDEVRITFSEEALRWTDTVSVVITGGKTDHLVCKHCNNKIAYIFGGVPSFSPGNKVKLVLANGNCVLDHTGGCCKEGTPCFFIPSDGGKRRSKWADHKFLLQYLKSSEGEDVGRGPEMKSSFPPHMPFPTKQEIVEGGLSSSQDLASLLARNATENNHRNISGAQMFLSEVFKKDFMATFARAMQLKPVMTVQPRALDFPLQFTDLESRSGCIRFKVIQVVGAPVFSKPKCDPGSLEEVKWLRKHTPLYVDLLAVIGVTLKALVKVSLLSPTGGRPLEYIGQVIRLDDMLGNQEITLHFDQVESVTGLLRQANASFVVSTVSKNYWYYAAINRALQERIASSADMRSGDVLPSRKLKLRDGSVIDLDGTLLEEAVRLLQRNEGLDKGQALAILTAFGLNRSASGIDHRTTLLTGPPGTGKTRTLTTLVGLICSNQPLLSGERCKILIACRTNNCVDDTAKKLKEYLLSIPSLKGPANVNDGLRIKIGRVGGVNWSSSDALAQSKYKKAVSEVKAASSVKISISRNQREREESLATELHGLQVSLTNAGRSIAEGGTETVANFSRLSDKMKESLHQLHALRYQREGKKLKKFDILLMTTSKAAFIKDLLRCYFKPTVIIIDEAAQEFSGVVLPTVRLESAKMVFICGDPNQLPPRSESQMTPPELFGSVMKTLEGVSSKAKLTTQYRMVVALSDIIRLSTPYASLVDAEEPLTRRDLEPYPFKIDKMHQPVVFFNAEGVERQLNIVGLGATMIPRLEEYLNDPTVLGTDADDTNMAASWSNAVEVECIKNYIENLQILNLPMSMVTVITPYISQVNCLKRALVAFLKPMPSEEYTEEDIERDKNLFIEDITTPEKYQGKENDIVLVSLVRCNPAGNIGFLAMEERLNVFLSRARNRLVLFGNFATFDKYVMKQPVEKLGSMLWPKLLQHLRNKEAIFSFPKLDDGSKPVVNDMEVDDDDDFLDALLLEGIKDDLGNIRLVESGLELGAEDSDEEDADGLVKKRKLM